MVKYGFREFVRNIYVNIFIALQLAIAFLIATAAVSSVLSRTEKYTPVKEYFSDCKGLYICDVSDSDAAILDDELKSIDEVETVIGGYKTNMYFSPSSQDLSSGLDESRKSVNALSEDYINAFTPQMIEGKWLSGAKTENGTVPAVITENDSYKTGDIVTVIHKQIVREMSPDEEDYDMYDPYVYEYVKTQLEIVGVIADKSELLGFSENDFTSVQYGQNNSPDFRDLYPTVDKSENIMMIVPKADIENLGCKIYFSGNLIVQMKDSTSTERMTELKFYLRDYGQTFDLAEFRKNSFVYINGQIIKLVPMFICIIILVIVSTVSASALSVKDRLKDYGIYYICGAKWRSCIFIGFISNLLTAVMAAGLAVCISNILILKGVYENTVIGFGKLHLLSCLCIAVLNIIMSLIIPISVMKRNTPKEILTSN